MCNSIRPSKRSETLKTDGGTTSNAVKMQPGQDRLCQSQEYPSSFSAINLPKIIIVKVLEQTIIARRVSNNAPKVERALAWPVDGQFPSHGILAVLG